ncbi:hypothetical protein [Beijerinckia sp. L45]|uniref:hypothetical protein n=1 Tax=Beijerinckia sp. L45 TaxID=1641855 RepID=UPI00131BF78E|nr:hypothetical protein [Beijerinckia sp. L45]
MLGAFFDDSGTHDGAPVTAIGGLLGTDEQWDLFDAKWKHVLANPVAGKPPLTRFHLSPCRAGEGEFRFYKPVERDYVTGRFRNVILDVGLVTIAAAVDRKAWHDLIVGEVAEEVGGPIELCFYKCMEAMIETIRLRKPGEQVVVGFDRGTRQDLEIWTRLYMTRPQPFPEIASMGFSAVSEVTALQGADLIVTETYQYAKECISKGADAVMNPMFDMFKDRELTAGLMFYREHVEEVASRIRTTIASR